MTPMTRTLIERAVASALGEDIATVRRLGFGPATLDDRGDAGDVRLVLDCPFCGRPVGYPGRGRDGAAALAECLPCDVYFDFEDDDVYVDPVAVAPAAVDATAA
jgi:hypothetical protein